MPEPTPAVCPSECDPDCDVGCHEHHAVPWKRHHDPHACPGNNPPPPEPLMPEPETTPPACETGDVRTCTMACPEHGNPEGAPPDDDQHVCKPGATTYYCPSGGETESDCHGGFDVCCARTDLHQQLVPCSLAALRMPHDGHSWEPQPGMTPVYCEGVARVSFTDVVEIATDEEMDGPDPWEPPVPAPPVPGLRDQIAGALLARIKQAVIIDPGPFSGMVGQPFAATEYDLADAVLAVVQPVIDDLTASRADWKALADQAKAGWDEAQQRAEAMERAMEDTAADALKHRGCHRSLMGQVQRAETAEAALDKVRGIDPDKLDLLADWFDTDDARKGPGRDFAVQADLRQWARTLRALTPPVPADQPEGGAR